MRLVKGQNGQTKILSSGRRPDAIPERPHANVVHGRVQISRSRRSDSTYHGTGRTPVGDELFGIHQALGA
jgi:hypothetical protein